MMMSFLSKILMAPPTILMLDVLYVSLTIFFISLTLLKLNCIDIRLSRCIRFTIVMTVIALLPSYVIMFATMAMNLDAYYYQLSVEIRALLISFFSLQNPIWLAAYFAAASRILRLPKRNIASSALLVFLFSELSALASDGAEFLYLPFRSLVQPQIGFSVAHIFLIALTSLGYICLMKYIDRNINKLKMIFEIGNKDKKHLALRSFLSACALWTLLAAGQFLLSTSDQEGKGYFFFAMVILIITLIFFTLRSKINNVALFQAQLQYDTLYGTMDNIYGVHHDMSNMLQVYSGFVQMKDYEGLESFHKKLFGETVKLNNKLNFHLQLKKSPALYGLIQSMEELAQKSNVPFTIENVALLIKIGLPDFDLCRVLSNLIKNAIEAAASAPDPAVQITVGYRPSDAIVIKITNTVSGKVDITDIFQSGLSTKPGHAGRGLLEVNKILAKYYGCTIVPIYEEPNFSMYVYLPPSNTAESLT